MSKNDRKRGKSSDPEVIDLDDEDSRSNLSFSDPKPKRRCLRDMSKEDIMKLEIEAIYKPCKVKLRRVDKIKKYKESYAKALAKQKRRQSSQSFKIIEETTPLVQRLPLLNPLISAKNVSTLSSNKFKKILPKNIPNIISSAKSIPITPNASSATKFPVNKSFLKNDRPISIVQKQAEEIRSLKMQLSSCRQVIQDLRKKLNSEPSEDSSSDLLPDPFESIAQLPNVPRPTLKRNAPLVCSKGYRIIDLQMLRISLGKALECSCMLVNGMSPQLSLLETDPNQGQKDFATELAFVCAHCNKATVFATSSFSETSPANFIVNKQLIAALGKKTYNNFKHLFQRTQIVRTIPRSNQMPSQYVLSLDNTCVIPKFNKKQLPSTSPPNHRTVFEEKQTVVLPEEIQNLIPPNSKLSLITPGSKIFGQIIKTTKEETGLELGVYQIIQNDKPLAKFIAIQNKINTNGVDGNTGEKDPLDDGFIHIPNEQQHYTNIGNNSLTIDLAQEEDDDDFDGPDPSQFLEVHCDDGGSEDDAVNATAEVENQPSVNGNYVGWMNPQEKALVEQKLLEEKEDSDFVPSEDGSEEDWKENRSSKKKKKKK